MICPCCDTINKDDAKVCKNCGIRLAGRKARPESQEQEKRYLKAGAAAVGVIALVLILVIVLTARICSGCEGNAGEEAIKDDVGGSYFAESGTDVDTSGADVVSPSGADGGQQ